MKNKIILTLLLFVLILSACSEVKPMPLSPAEQALQAINEKTSVSEIANPNLTLPSDINSTQIQKYFEMGDFYFALVQRNSMNVWLELPKDFVPSFAGILIAKKDDKAWTKMTEIKDSKPTDKNNPYYLIVKDGELLLTVVDQNGAGSGEGYMKLYNLTKTGDWNLQNCYYFGADYSGVETDGDVFAYSIQFQKQEPKPLESCQNVQLIKE